MRCYNRKRAIMTCQAILAYYVRLNPTRYFHTRALSLGYRHSTNRYASTFRNARSYTPSSRIHDKIPKVPLFESPANFEDKSEPPSTKKTRKPQLKVKTSAVPRKIKVADEGGDLDALIAAFDALSKKDGFDSSTAYYSTDSTSPLQEEEEDIDPYDALDDGDDEVDDELLDFNDNDANLSMEERILQAKKDRDMGRVQVSKDLQDFSNDITDVDLSKLGFKRELNPFGNDETPRKEQFKLITNAMSCSACGVEFQSKDEAKPGFLPVDKYDIQVKLAKIEDINRIQDKSNSRGWSPEDEVDWLIGGPAKKEQNDIKMDAYSMADSMGLDLLELSKKKVICKRCHGLQNFGEVPDILRPGWSEEPLLSQEAFRNLLLPLQFKKCVIIALVDLFDFSGSVLPELDSIAGENPVIIAANKADLFPSKMGHHRAENWVRRELEYLGVKSLANIGGAVRLISCKTGFGVRELLGKARDLADDLDCDLYLVGAANSGKSSLINFILASEKRDDGIEKKRSGNANKWKGDVTASPLPGTTLKFIKVDIGFGRSLYDTPGLLVPGSFTQRLTPAELKMVVPKKPVRPVTLRVATGKCVLIGGLAKVEVKEDSKPFLLTFYVSNDIKLHLTDSSKADEFIEKHVGESLSPPLSPGMERMKEIGEWDSHDLEINGNGWKEAAADISIRGLGWVAVTGAGNAGIRVSVPRKIGVSVRPPLMPYDIWDSAASFTGSRAVIKSKSGKGSK